MKSDSSARTLYDASRDDLAALLAGEPAYRVEQTWKGLYESFAEPANITTLSAALRTRLTEQLPTALIPARESVSNKGDTVKFLWRLADGNHPIETVLMHYADRATVCVSTQAGCAMACGFCATGQAGFNRQLTVGEIVEQVVRAARHAKKRKQRVANIVFMGMGEPLANMDAVTETIRILHDDRGLNLGARRLTVSTSGLVPQIRELTKLDLQVGLAISLHATTDELRDELVPVNKRWPIRELLDAAQEYGQSVGRRVTLEYTLLGGVNDSDDDADRLAAFARRMPSKVNIIPYNPVPGLPWQRPTPEAIDRFVHRLLPKAPAVTVRHTQGGDIWAACGQLGGLS